jgi:hypothetical protein
MPNPALSLAELILLSLKDYQARLGKLFAHGA